MKSHPNFGVDGSCVVIVPRISQFANCFLRLKEILGSRGSQADDDFGIDDLQLKVQKRTAVGGFLVGRNPVVIGVARISR